MYYLLATESQHTEGAERRRLERLANTARRNGDREAVWEMARAVRMAWVDGEARS